MSSPRRGRAVAVVSATAAVAVLAGVGGAVAAVPHERPPADRWAHDYSASEYATRVQGLAGEAASERPVRVRSMSSGTRIVQVSTVVRGAADDVETALVTTETASSGVILDLRGNGGGLVSEAVGLAGVFISGGSGVTYSTSEGALRSVELPEGGGAVNAALVVLVDEGTASAAEMIAGILQDRGRAVVVGTRTFGKGTVQEPILLHDGRVREETVGTYALPSGRTIDGVGITPDVLVSSEASEREVLSVAAQVLAGLAPVGSRGR